MLVRAIGAVIFFVLTATFILAGLPGIADQIAEVRTEPTQDVGLGCSTGTGETSCTITLTQEDAYPDTTDMVVTETSPGSVDRTNQSTVQADRLMIAVTGLVQSTAYVFTVDYQIVDAQVSDGLNSVLSFMPFLVAIGGLVLVVVAVIIGFGLFRLRNG